MDLKITIKTNKKNLIDRILDLVSGEDVEVILDSSENNFSGDLGLFINDLAKNFPVTSIKDPVLWQREIREDRELPFSQ